MPLCSATTQLPGMNALLGPINPSTRRNMGARLIKMNVIGNNRKMERLRIIAAVARARVVRQRDQARGGEMRCSGDNIQLAITQLESATLNLSIWQWHWQQTSA